MRGPLNERQQTSLHHREASGRQLLTPINDILDKFKVEAGRLELQMQTVSVAGVLPSVSLSRLNRLDFKPLLTSQPR